MSLKAKTAKGIFWSGTSQVSKQIFQFIITAILARLLSPSDFGILGMATVFTAFITIFNEMGITAAIVKEKAAETSKIPFIYYFIGALFLVAVYKIAAVINRRRHQDGTLRRLWSGWRMPRRSFKSRATIGAPGSQCLDQNRASAISMSDKRVPRRRNIDESV